MLIDLDIVNPFFPQRGAETPLLLENGVEVVYPAYALSGVDIPILPAEVERAFATDARCVFDVGGDDDGAVALGRYHAQFAACPAEVYFVVNPIPPPHGRCFEQALAPDARASQRRARHGQVTGLAVNANLGAETGADELRAGREFIRTPLAGRAVVPVAFEAGPAQALCALPERLAAPVRAALSRPGMDGLVWT